MEPIDLDALRAGYRGKLTTSSWSSMSAVRVSGSFQLITLNLATMASEHRQLRKFAEIRKGWLG